MREPRSIIRLRLDNIEALLADVLDDARDSLAMIHAFDEADVNRGGGG